jgi:hypothetical protein
VRLPPVRSVRRQVQASSLCRRPSSMRVSSLCRRPRSSRSKSPRVMFSSSYSTNFHIFQLDKSCPNCRWSRANCEFLKL